jgi:hypothetical protein
VSVDVEYAVVISNNDSGWTWALHEPGGELVATGWAEKKIVAERAAGVAVEGLRAHRQARLMQAEA